MLSQGLAAMQNAVESTNKTFIWGFSKERHCNNQQLDKIYKKFREKRAQLLQGVLIVLKLNTMKEV